jgi:hypothetical protein
MTEAKTSGLVGAFDALPPHPRFEALVTLVRAVATRMATDRRLEWKPLADSVSEADRGSLTAEDTKTELGELWSVLEHGPKTADEERLLAALWAHAIAEAPPRSTEEEDVFVSRVVWLAASTPFDATPLLDRVLGDHAEPFWKALGAYVEQAFTSEVHEGGRGLPVFGALLLSSSSSSGASKEARRVAARVGDKAIAGLLAPTSLRAELKGELVAPPRSPAITVLMAVTGVLFVCASARVAARLALGYQRPAELFLSNESIRIRSRTVVLGRNLRERDLVLPRPGLQRAIREVRYPRAAFYAGLFFLSLGSLFGVHTFIDGVRSASPSLLFYGVVVIALGVALDFLLSLPGSGAAGRCGLVFVNRDGRAFAVRGVDATAADQALARLAEAKS